MGKIIIINAGSPVQIGAVICHKGAEVSVDEDALIDYGKTDAGIYNLKHKITVIDQDYKKKISMEKSLIEEKALLEAEKKVGPNIEKRIKAELDAKYKKQIVGFEKKIEALNKIIVSLNDRLDPDKTITNIEETETETETTGEGDDTDEFVFDPEIHHIEHRGGGNWYIMQLEDKIFGPLTPEDKTKYEELLK